MIYPATQKNLEQATGHARYASTRVAGEHVITAVRNGQREEIEVWEDGRKTWPA